MVEAVAGDTSELALDHAVAADVLGTLLGEDLGAWARVLRHGGVRGGSGCSGRPSGAHSDPKRA